MAEIWTWCLRENGTKRMQKTPPKMQSPATTTTTNAMRACSKDLTTLAFFAVSFADPCWGLNPICFGHLFLATW